MLFNWLLIKILRISGSRIYDVHHLWHKNSNFIHSANIGNAKFHDKKDDCIKSHKLLTLSRIGPLSTSSERKLQCRYRTHLTKYKLSLNSLNLIVILERYHMEVN